MSAVPTPRVLDKRRPSSSLFDVAATLHRDADQILTYDVDDLDWEAAVRVGDELRKAKLAVAAAEEFVAKRAGKAWPGKWKDELTVEGVGRAHPYRTSNTKWDHDELVREVVDRHMTEAGGEIPDPAAAVRWLVDVAHIDYWRVGLLKKLGVDVEDYRHTEYGAVRLSIKSDHMVGDTTTGATT